MIQNILWTLFFIITPGVVLWLVKRFPFLDKIGPVVLCYVIGAFAANAGLLPSGLKELQNQLLEATIALALPLLFFSIDIRKWARLAGRSILSIFFALIAVITAVTLSFIVFGPAVGPQSWKVGGMLVGCYTGGTPNLAAIKTALSVDPTLYITTHTADTVIGAFFLLGAMTIFKPVLLRWMPDGATVKHKNGMEDEEFSHFFNIHGITQWMKLGGMFLLSGGIVGISLLLGGLFPQGMKMSAIILLITTLGVASSFVPQVRKTKGTFHLGYYIILIFSVVVSSLAVLSELIHTGPAIFGFVAMAVFGTFIIHTFLSALGKIDTDTHIITSMALVMSPPFVPMVAASLKNREIMVTGIIAGIFGWVIGNYIGIGYAHLLKMFLY